jgi:GDP-4-dehydro-6-deoxy-D-mannose reductase
VNFAGKVLVLGASGFFGNWIRRELTGAGIEVIAPEREGRIDLRDAAALRALIGRHRPDAVVNAAGMTSPAAAVADPAGCFEINAGGVFNLLEALRLEAPKAHLVALSSATVYTGPPPFTEESATGASAPYAASKLAMEILCGQYARGHGMKIAVVRCFNLIGPGEPASQVTSEFALAALAAGPDGSTKVPVGDPATARDFTDVRDGARAVAAMLERGATGTLNLCSGRATTLAEIAAILGELSGTRIDLNGSGSGPASGLLTVSGDGTRLREATGWEPVLDLGRSLADLLDSLRNSATLRA